MTIKSFLKKMPPGTTVELKSNFWQIEVKTERYHPCTFQEFISNGTTDKALNEVLHRAFQFFLDYPDAFERRKLRNQE